TKEPEHYDKDFREVKIPVKEEEKPCKTFGDKKTQAYTENKALLFDRLPRRQIYETKSLGRRRRKRPRRTWAQEVNRADSDKGIDWSTIRKLIQD
ncbi:hypothetical protein ILUMI_17032, partial [Ignelater luminosus]